MPKTQRSDSILRFRLNCDLPHISRFPYVGEIRLKVLGDTYSHTGNRLTPVNSQLLKKLEVNEPIFSIDNISHLRS